MYYTITCDGKTLYDLKTGYTLISPVLEMEDNSAGSLEFTIAPDNPMYDKIHEITSEIIVYRDGVEIWSGRPIEEKIDFYKRKVVYCEGELAYLNDSIQEPAEYHDQTVRQWLTTLLNKHNNRVAASKRFYVGAVTVEDNLYRYTNYENTLYCISDKLVKRLGGHLRIRKTGGKRYLDYLKDYPKRSTQTIEFGRNLLDYSNNYSLSDIATVIIPLGARQDTSPIDGLEAYLDVRSVNSGSIYVQNNTAVNNFGWICKVVRWNDVTTASQLLRKAREYLNNLQYDEMGLEIKPVDFNLVDKNQPSLDMLDEVRVISKPHGLDKWFPITKQRIPLGSPNDATYVMGILDHKSMTVKTSSAIQALQDAIDDIAPESSILKQAKENATQLIISGALGSHVVVKPDEIYVMNTSDERTASKVWRWNVNGLGYSSNGINGPYGTAITMDGRIVADYITTGTMYADRIKGGTLSLGGSSNTNGVIKMYDSSRNLIGQWDNTGMTIQSGSINLGKGQFVVSSDGRITAKSLTANQDIFVSGNEKSYIKMAAPAINGYTKLDSNGLLQVQQGQFIRAGYTPNRGGSTGVLDGFSVSNTEYNDTRTKYVSISNTGLNILGSSGGDSSIRCSLGNNGISFVKDQQQFTSIAFGSSKVWGDLYVAGNGRVIIDGTKSRLVETEEYSNRLLYCYETPSPLFGDVGEGTIADDGKCYVFIDSIFAKTVALTQYQVFIQKYGSGNAYISERTPGYFVVEGTPGLSFGWELKAKQADYDQLRLEKYTDTNLPDPADYGSLAIEHINQILDERIIA